MLLQYLLENLTNVKVNGETNKEINVADFLSFVSSQGRFYPEVLHIINECDETLEEKVFNDYLKTINGVNRKRCSCHCYSR